MKAYEWVMLPGIKQPRPKCREHGKVMKWALKISKDYPPRQSAHTGEGQRWRVPVMINGLILQVYRCPEQGCCVEAVK